MKIIISPAKTLNFNKELPSQTCTESAFLKESRLINKTLKLYDAKSLGKMMTISDSLAQLNWQRNKVWKTPFTASNARQAVYAFDGDVYAGLDAYTLNTDQQHDMQDKLRILSGLYGLLKPFDLIQAYRLEMGTKIAIGESADLYKFWRPKITAALNKELRTDEMILNLASQEYFGVLHVKNLKVPVIQPEFKDYHNGNFKVISFFAKRARGLMVRYILDTKACSIADLKGFDYEGYRFDDAMSTSNKLVFTR